MVVLVVVQASVLVLVSAMRRVSVATVAAEARHVRRQPPLWYSCGVTGSMANSACLSFVQLLQLLAHQHAYQRFLTVIHMCVDQHDCRSSATPPSLLQVWSFIGVRSGYGVAINCAVVPCDRCVSHGRRPEQRIAADLWLGFVRATWAR